MKKRIKKKKRDAVFEDMVNFFNLFKKSLSALIEKWIIGISHDSNNTLLCFCWNGKLHKSLEKTQTGIHFIRSV